MGAILQTAYQGSGLVHNLYAKMSSNPKFPTHSSHRSSKPGALQSPTSPPERRFCKTGLGTMWLVARPTWLYKLPVSLSCAGWSHVDSRPAFSRIPKFTIANSLFSKSKFTPKITLSSSKGEEVLGRPPSRTRIHEKSTEGPSKKWAVVSPKGEEVLGCPASRQSGRIQEKLSSHHL